MGRHGRRAAPKIFLYKDPTIPGRTPDEIAKVQRLGKLWHLNPEQDLLWREIPAIADILQACADELPDEVKESLELTRTADRAGMSVQQYREHQRMVRFREQKAYKEKRKRFTHAEITAQTEANKRRGVNGRYVLKAMEG